MEQKYYRNLHLAKSESEIGLTEFEWSIMRFYEAYTRWVTSVGSLLVDADIKFAEFLILHVVRIQDRPKNSATIARLINRDDIPNIQYSLRKLESAKLIEKSSEKSGKTFLYNTTKEGQRVTDEYAQLRSDLLLRAISTISNIQQRMADMTQLLTVLTGIYDEMARNSATFSLR